MNIDKQLKKYRIAIGKTQKEVAEELHLSRQSISKWENGKTIPDLDNIIRLAKFYGVSIDNLVTEQVKVCSEKVVEHSSEEYVISKNEGLTLLILSFIGFLVAPLGLITSVIILKRNNTNNTYHKLTNTICVICILFNLFVIYSLIGDYVGWGITNIEKLD